MHTPTRLAAEIVPEIASRLAVPGVNGCVALDGPKSKQHCPRIAELQAELATSERRSAILGAIAQHDDDIAKLGAPTIANKDAAAIAHVLAALGLKVDTETINTWLMCLAVLVLEVGPALSLTVATALRLNAPAASVMRDVTPAPQSTPMEPVASVPAIITPTALAPTQTATLARDTANRVAKVVRDAGGELRMPSKNALAKSVGATSGTMTRALAVLVASGAVVASDATGVSIEITA